jgi:hypothetical protein
MRTGRPMTMDRKAPPPTSLPHRPEGCRCHLAAGCAGHRWPVRHVDVAGHEIPWHVDPVCDLLNGAA